jgi:hypothetical protein
MVTITDTKGDGRVDLHNDEFLDTASSANILRNADLLVDIRACRKQAHHRQRYGRRFYQSIDNWRLSYAVW